MKRTISILLLAVMLLSALYSCEIIGTGENPDTSSGSGNKTADINISGKISPDKEAVIGSHRDGITVTIPSGIFGDATSVSVSTADIKAENGTALISPVYEIKEQSGTHDLGGDVSVKINITADTEYKDCITFMGAYYDGTAWEYIEPDLNAFGNGYITFTTPHFSPFAAVKVSKDKAIDEYASRLAVQSVTDKQEDKAVLEAVTDCFNETFDAMGFTDKTAQGILMQAIAKESDFGAFVVAAKTGNISDFSGKAAELIAKATLKNMWSEEFTGKMTGRIGSIASGVVAVMEKVYDGDYKEAYKAFVSSAAEYFPAVRAFKATYAACQAGRELWVDYSVECGYKLHLGENPSADGKLEGMGSEDSWRSIFSLMSSSVRLMVDDYKAMYAAANDMTVAQIDADSSLCSKINAVVEENLKKQFMQRYKSAKEIAAEEAKIKKQIEQFDYYGLLENDTLRGWGTSMSLSERLAQLYRIRENIIELAGGDASVFGGNSELQNEALAVAINEWITCGTDRGAFIKWLEGQGYIKKPEKPVEKFAWVLQSENVWDKFVLQIDDPSGGDGYYYTLSCSGTGFNENGKYVCKECAACGAKNGHIYYASVSVTRPPDTIYADETVTVPFTIEGTGDDCRLAWENSSFGASFKPSFRDYTDWFKDKDGNGGARTDVDDGIVSLSSSVSYTMISGRKEGDTAVLMYHYPRDGKYVYTYVWTKVG